jgi:hypothetical protein
MDAFSAAEAVADFHRAFGLPIRQRPDADIDPGLAQLRMDIAPIVSAHTT